MSDVQYSDPTPEPSPAPEADQAEAARGAAAQRLTRGTLRGAQTPETALPTVGSQEDYDKVKPGSFYKDPEGNKRKRLYEVKEANDYTSIPEGEEYTDPEGNVREKPRSAPISMSSQILFNMATNDKEKRKALELSYPGKVTNENGEWLVDDGGQLRKPKGMTETAQGLGGGMLAAAAPTIGAVGFEIAGALLGNLPGAVGGAMVGGALGQSFNDAVLAALGVYDRSLGEQAAETAIGGGLAAGGTIVGRALGAAAPVIKGGVKNAGPAMLANFLGADKEALTTVMEMKRKGLGLVGPSTFAKEAPHLQQIAETLDPALRTQGVLQQSMEKYYEDQAHAMLTQSGVTVPTKLLEPEAKVSSRVAGQQLLDKASAEVVASDAKIEAEFAAKQSALEAGAVGAPSKTGLEIAAKEARGKAKELIDAGFQSMEQDVDAALKSVKAGHNTGDLWQMVADKLKGIHTMIIGRSQKFYGDAYKVAGNFRYATADIAEDAKAFLSEIPEEFQKAYPSLIAKLKNLGGIADAEGGWVKEPVESLDLKELHGIRSLLRYASDWYALPSDFKNGALKHFAGKVDSVIQNVPKGSEAETAIKMLNATDEWYGEQVKVFNARNIKTVMDGLKAGEPADPTALRDVIVKPGQSDLTKKLLEMVGPNMAAAIRAADVKEMLNAARTANPGEIDVAKFAHEVVGRYQDDVLHVLHGKEGAEKLLKQAQDILGLEGKLTIKALPGDTTRDVVMKAQAAKEAADAAAKADPLKALQVGTRKLQIDQQRAQRLSREQVSEGPLNFLYNADYGAVKAADTILKSEDLLFAAAGKFGRDSAEFQELQKVWLARILTGGMDVTQKLVGYSAEAQSLMMPPGVSVAQLQTLGREMQLLLSQRGVGGTGASIMAQHAVAHPGGYLPATGHSKGIKWVASTAVGRSALTKYTTFVVNLTNNPTLLRYIVKGLEGNEAERAATRHQIQQWAKKGGAIGAGAAESLQSTPEQPE